MYEVVCVVENQLSTVIKFIEVELKPLRKNDESKSSDAEEKIEAIELTDE
jgi:hypothetical protein